MSRRPPHQRRIWGLKVEMFNIFPASQMNILFSASCQKIITFLPSLNDTRLTNRGIWPLQNKGEHIVSPNLKKLEPTEDFKHSKGLIVNKNVSSMSISTWRPVDPIEYIFISNKIRCLFVEHCDVAAASYSIKIIHL